MHKGADVPGNELVMRIQPDEALYLKTFSKEPGLAQVVKPTVMDMKYATQFEGAYVGDAYERCPHTIF
jgi:glucose-6-phosphate 1-dehydrogenase